MSQAEGKTRTESKNAVFEHLYGLAQQGKPVENGDVIIIREDPGRGALYLQGSPMWSSFGERAFVFANEADAQELIDKFPDIFENCRVHRSEP